MTWKRFPQYAPFVKGIHRLLPDSPHNGPAIMWGFCVLFGCHYCDVIMDAIASQITSLTIVYSTVHSGADQRKHQSPASLAFVRGIHLWPVNSPHKGPVMWKSSNLMTSSCSSNKQSRSCRFEMSRHSGTSLECPTTFSWVWFILFNISDPQLNHMNIA